MIIDLLGGQVQENKNGEGNMTMTRCIRTWFVMALFWKGTFSSKSISGPTKVGSELGSPLSVIAVGPTCAGGSPDKAHHSPYQFFFLFFFLLSLSPSLNWNRFCLHVFISLSQLLNFRVLFLYGCMHTQLSAHFHVQGPLHLTQIPKKVSEWVIGALQCKRTE